MTFLKLYLKSSNSRLDFKKHGSKPCSKFLDFLVALKMSKNVIFWPEKIKILKILVPILFKMKMAKTDKIFKSQKVPKRSKFFQIWKNTNKAEILIFSSFWKTVQKMWKFYKNGKYRDRIRIGQKWKIEN